MKWIGRTELWPSIFTLRKRRVRKTFIRVELDHHLRAAKTTLDRTRRSFEDLVNFKWAAELGRDLAHQASTLGGNGRDLGKAGVENRSAELICQRLQRFNVLLAEGIRSHALYIQRSKHTSACLQGDRKLRSCTLHQVTAELRVIGLNIAYQARLVIACNPADD